MKNYVVYSEAGSIIHVKASSKKEVREEITKELPGFKIANIFPTKQ